jgi:hypothetical protein
VGPRLRRAKEGVNDGKNAASFDLGEAPLRSTSSLGNVAHWARWLLVLPSAVVAWYVALLLGIGIESFIESLCPQSRIVSGMCVASWFPISIRLAICAGSAAAGILIIVFCTLVAPKHRYTVAMVTLGAGSLAAVGMALQSGQYAAMASAIAAGALAVWCLRRGGVFRTLA